jgi:8-oxo-dGTP diphosphatase
LAFLAEVAEGEASAEHLIFAVEERLQPGLIGCGGLRIKGKRAELGYWLGVPYWGKGYASEVAAALSRLAFEELGMDEVHAEVMAENPASGRVLEKAGLNFGGEGMGERGRCSGVDTLNYALTRDQWLERQAARPTVLVSAVALVDADGRILLAQRPEGKSMAGLWEFPGGKVHGGETPEAALIRELHEELDIDTAQSCLAPFTFASYAYEDFHLLMPLYVCRRWQGIVRPLEGQTLQWVRPAQMGNFPMPPADVPLVAMLRDFL